MRRLLLLLWLLSPLALAAEPPPGTQPEVINVRFDTDPPGARVSVDVTGGADEKTRSSATDNLENLQRLQQSPDGTWRINLQNLPGRFVLLFELDGCEPRQLSLVQDNLRPERSKSFLVPTAHPGVYRYKEKVGLQIKSPWLWVRYHALLVGVLLLGFGGVVGGYLIKRREAARLKTRDEERRRLVAAEHPRFPLLGKVVGGYLLVDKLGYGGFAAVYRGLPEDTLDEREAVAVKVIQPDLDDPEFRERFNREINVTKQLEHPNIVRVINWGDHEGTLYLVMEMVKGTPLQIPARGMEPAAALALLNPIIDALLWAHNRGIVHRDIKPDNIMVTAQGKVKLMDFGIARGRNYKTLTVTGNALGTPGYMAPEQLMGTPVDQRADQYSLGVMAYEMLCGRRPFGGEDAMQELSQQLTGQPTPLLELNPQLQPALADAVMRTLARDPAARFPSLTEVKAALNSAGKSL